VATKRRQQGEGRPKASSSEPSRAELRATGTGTQPRRDTEARPQAESDGWPEWVAARTVRVAAGTYRRGQDEGGYGDERPAHQVTISRAFELWRTPLTQGEWQRIVRKNPSQFVGADRPVERVTWFEAVAWCNALSRAMGLTEAYELQSPTSVAWRGLDCPGFRLPTEAEWEYACRAGTTEARYGSLVAVAWYGDDSGFETRPVGLKLPNAWGLHDMLGNVWEWCWDCMAEYVEGAVTDPTGPAKGRKRVYRGGGYGNDAEDVRAASRYGFAPGSHADLIGFRPARTIG
jgi:sulfatase modifying factor 1